jgi:hypothetical protein
VSKKEIIRDCIAQCSKPQNHEWQAWRATVSAYSQLRAGSKERNMAAWMSCEAARRIGEWLRTK